MRSHKHVKNMKSGDNIHRNFYSYPQKKENPKLLSIFKFLKNACLHKPPLIFYFSINPLLIDE